MFLLTATCEAGHTQEIRVDFEGDRLRAELLAGLLDGTSPMYRTRPGQESVIGTCGICRQKFKVIITEE